MRPILILLCGLFSLTLAAQDKKIVVSSASMMWDMVKNIAGDKVDNKLIVPIGGDPHIYDPTPADAQKVANADLIFVNGLTFEGWINELIENSGTKGKTITVTEGINAISSSIYKNAYDPHAWMDVSLALIYIKNIKDGLVELDPKNTDFYNSNYSNYKERLEDLDAYIMKNINKIPEAQRILITSHDAFSYYGRRYGLQVEGVIGISTESEAQTSDMIRIQETIKDSGVPAIFVETTINPQLLEQIAKDNNVSIGGSLFADSIGEKGSGGHSYYDMLKSNTDVIVNALTQTATQGYKPTQATDSKSSSLMAYGVLALVLILALVFLIIKMNK